MLKSNHKVLTSALPHKGCPNAVDYGPALVYDRSIYEPVLPPWAKLAERTDIIAMTSSPSDQCH